MRKVLVIFSASLLLWSCGGNSDAPDTSSTAESAAAEKNSRANETARGAKTSPSKARSKGPVSDAVFTHNLIRLTPSSYGGNCEINGTISNDGAQPLASLMMVYEVSYSEPDARAVRGVKGRAIKKLSTAPAYGDKPLIPGETRPVIINALDTDCSNIASLKLLAFTCTGQTKDIYCTADSLNLENKLSVPATR